MTEIDAIVSVLVQELERRSSVISRTGCGHEEKVR
jgi:hypothetical protein